MSIIIEYKNGSLYKCKKLRGKNVPSPIYFNKEENFICRGELFDVSYDELMKMPWIENPKILNDIKGAIAVVRAEAFCCDFAVDMNGLDTFYYYHQNNHFLLSDELWDIVKRIVPNEDDINREFVREALFEGGSQDGNTIIKNLKVLMPNQYAKYDAKANKLTVQNFFQFKYSNICKNIDEAIQNFDALLYDAMQSIKKKCGDVRYGIGISGGLDSRIISHYAKKCGMDIVGFNICVPKPHRLFYARSVKNAYKIAENFNIPYQNVRWLDNTVLEKIRFSIKQYPIFSGNAFKYETSNLPDFEVLLTGGSGLIVGSQFPADLEKYTAEELAEAIFDLFAGYTATTLKDRIARATNYLFKLNKISLPGKRIKSKWGELLIGENYDEIVFRNILNFVKKRKSINLSNIDIFADYFLNVCGYQNRNGAFESLLATKRAFSIYVPFLLKETMRWTPELLIDRRVLNELIIQKIPEVSNIKSESFFTAPKKSQSNFLDKWWSMIDFIIRGNGTAIDQYYLKKRKMRKQFIYYMNMNTHDWFHKLFHMDSMTVSNEMVIHEPTRIVVRIWELKRLIDCLESKEYMKF